MNKGIFKLFFGLVIVMMIGSFIFKGSLVMNNMKEGKPTFIIKVPSYDGTNTTYMCNEYHETNGCIQFKDELGFEQKVCQQYSVKKWK